MASSASTFATLRALHLVISDALDDIQRVFSQNSLPESPSPASPCSSPAFANSPDFSPAASPFPTTPPTSFPPTPLSATFAPADTGIPFVDYPSPDLPYLSDSPSEQLALLPDAVAAASRIVAACGQLSNIVHKPFSSLCDSVMNYSLPACMRLVEHLHIAEILREAEENRQRSLTGRQGAIIPIASGMLDPSSGPSGPVHIPNSPRHHSIDVPPPMDRSGRVPTSRVHKDIGEGVHVADITDIICSYAGDNYVDASELVHVLRLLSTHHIFRETSPDTFALNRVASLLDCGKSVEAIFSNPESKYDDTDGIPAFVALSTDELFKSAAYLTEAFTGVQLPTQASAPNRSFLGDAISSGKAPSSSRCVINEPASCAPTTRSSSVLAHIAYPEDESVRPPSNLLPEPLDHSGLLSPSTVTPVSSRPLPPEIPIAALAQEKKKRLLSRDVTKPEKLLAFNLAFHTNMPFFEWLEDGGEDPLGGTGQGACTCTQTRMKMLSDVRPAVSGNERPGSSMPEKPFRLQRFSKAMTGTTGWEAPKAILSGFDWHSIPKGSTIVDVGGGIGSTTMILARTLNNARFDLVKRNDTPHVEEPATSRHRPRLLNDPPFMVGDELQNNAIANDSMDFRFVVQDRPVVTTLGIEAWRSRCPDMLESGQVQFQDQDFFEPQPPFKPPHISRSPAVYLLRVVLHDWPDEFARRILINLRVASNPETRLVIAEHVLPLACTDEDILDQINAEAREGTRTDEWSTNLALAHIDGAERTLVPPPLLANLGKASANAYWMDLTMHITLNGKERTLREFCTLTLSAGWRIARMTRPEGSLFAYLVCEPIPLPDDAQAIYNAIVLSSELSTVVTVPSEEPLHHSDDGVSRPRRLPTMPLLPSPVIERSSSGTPTFGSRILLPKDEELQSPRARNSGIAKKWLKSKGLGVRGVIMQRADKQKEPNSSKDAPTRDDSDVQNAAPNSSSHGRVWWKKSPPNSTSNSSTTIHELGGEVSVQRATRRKRKMTLKSNESPSTPSPRLSPVHRKWPSIESTALPMSEISPTSVSNTGRRPSVASITRKLSFATFRRPSIADITQPLPTPPPSATLTELAPPPTLHGDTERRRSLKHLPSLPALGRSEVTATGQSAIPRRPSLSFAGKMPTTQPISKPTLPRRPDMSDLPMSGILKSNPHTSKQSYSNAGGSAELTLTLNSRRQRRITLSNSPGAPPRTQAPTPGSMLNAPPEPASLEPEVRRIPSVPRMPRRLSIPMLRRKQSHSVIQDAETGGYLTKQ